MATYGISTYGTAIGVSAGDIKNLALFTLGFPDEIDFTDLTNETVKKVNRVYSTTLLFVLTNYPWRFVLKRTELTDRTVSTSSSKYKYNYTLPVQLLAVKGAYTDEGYTSRVKYFESSPKFLNTDATNADGSLFLWYISIIDETDFPQYFIDYFKYKLALDLCFNLTGDTDLLQMLAQQEQKQLLTSKNIDAKQVQTRTISSSPFTQIRR